MDPFTEHSDIERLSVGPRKDQMRENGEHTIPKEYRKNFLTQVAKSSNRSGETAFQAGILIKHDDRCRGHEKSGGDQRTLYD